MRLVMKTRAHEDRRVGGAAPVRRDVQSRWGHALASLALMTVAASAFAGGQPLPASERAAQLDQQVDWSRARLIVVQEGGRYKPLESFAREAFAAMSGHESLPGLSPVASMLEWLFNREAYVDEPLVKVREKAVRMRLGAHLDDARRDELLDSRMMTVREFGAPEAVAQIREMQTHNIMRSAVNRIFGARATALRLDEMLAFVPQPGGDKVDPWATVDQIAGNLSPAAMQQLGIAPKDLSQAAFDPLPGLSSDAAQRIIVDWKLLKKAWLAGDAPGVQQRLDRLAAYLPSLAGADVYPSQRQLVAEVQYYRFGKFTWGYLIYFLALLFSVFAMLTRWRWSWGLAMLLIFAALGLHAYGIGLRWSILGRIPVANMFEAVVGSAWIGIAIAFVVELFMRTRIFLVAMSATGFLALLLGMFVLPGAELSTMMGILDDAMLRIHTVTIITAYALIYLAAVIAVIYLIGYYFLRAPEWMGAPRTDASSAAPLGGLGFMQRPVLAGALPGDEADKTLPRWLNDFDWAHLIILNMVFIFLFVGGVVLGAWWADYSWGRPWGWDPKEVFALNTWIVYAILLHVRMIVKRRGLWTAWLSIAGCTVMAFNWYYVNFYISSVHSYA